MNPNLSRIIDDFDRTARQQMVDAMRERLDFEEASFLEYETHSTISYNLSTRGMDVELTGRKAIVVWNYILKPVQEPPPPPKPTHYPTLAKDIAKLLV